MSEGASHILAMLTWMLFGASVVGPMFDNLSISILIYSLLSLSIVRILPVMLILWRSHTPLKEALFIGWFGPKGLASVVFATQLLHSHSPASEVLLVTAAATIFLSVVLHGITAGLLPD